VAHWRTAFRQMGKFSAQRLSIEMGLAGVLSTQLWHHLFIESSLSELPARTVNQSSALPAGS
jgi:asparagine synthase (glutamine-hydrolysing)